MISTPLKTSDISIIIPTLNEEVNIEPLAHNIDGGDWEIIIVDGGSTDNTVQFAREQNFKVLQSQPGRAEQQNHGASRAQGKVLLFLHADTRLPENFADIILLALSRKPCNIGAFRLAIADPTPAMRFISGCANLRSSLLHLPYGDQALFVNKNTFLKLGRFPVVPIMEDYLFIKKAKKTEKIILLEEKVTTSARRWKKLGVWRTTLVNQLIILGYLSGISLEKLALFYRR